MKPITQARYHLGLLICLVTLLPLLVVSCTKPDGPPLGAGDVDTSDPEAVAEAFIAAVMNNNIEEAAQYVISEDRADFIADFKRAVPPIPKNPKVLVEIRGDRGEAKIENTGIDIDMKRKDGRWWIIR